MHWAKWLLLGLAPAPSALATLYLHQHCKPTASATYTATNHCSLASSLPSSWPAAASAGWCCLGLAHPFLAVNLLFLANVCLGFWLVSLVQRSTWLIDPYWTLLPPLIGAFYASHPAAAPPGARSRLVAVLLCVWSARLTHSYFRREKWQLGAREDWRFAQLRGRLGRHWWWASFFLVYLSQQAMLCGITAPLLPVFQSAAPWHPLWDSLATLACCAGLVVACLADNQLHRFVAANERRAARGRPPKPLLDTGLWRASRHPNYVGEQLWWWGLAGFAARLGCWPALAGPAFNTLCMVEVTRMVEQRMLARPERAALYRRYQQATPAWLPWPRWPGAQRQLDSLAASAAASPKRE